MSKIYQKLLLKYAFYSITAAFSIILLSGCVIGRPQILYKSPSMKTVPVTEGIIMKFDNIPDDTEMIYIFTRCLNNNENTQSSYNYSCAYTFITDKNLENIKKTKTVLFPFVQPGQKYEFSVYIEKNGAPDSEYINEFITSECVSVDRGIYIKNKIEFNLNDSKTIASLNAEPQFSSSLEFSDVKYLYNLTASFTLPCGTKGEVGLGSGETPDKLYWDFEYLKNMNFDSLKTSLGYESFNAYITAFSAIMFEGNKWMVEIAKTSIFDLSIELFNN